MKKGMDIHINFQKKDLWLFSIVVVLFVGVGFVVAFGDYLGNEAQVNGHSSDEVMVNMGGNLVTLQSAINAGFLGGSSIPLSVDSSGDVFDVKYSYSSGSPSSYYKSPSSGGFVHFFTQSRTGGSFLWIFYSEDGSTWYWVREGTASGGAGISLFIPSNYYFAFATNMLGTSETGNQIRTFTPLDGSSKPIKQ